MKLYKGKALAIFVSISMVASLLLVNMNVPVSAEQSEIYLHGPSLTPIHMHGPSLVPIHMHSKMGIISLYEPMWTPWHEVHPEYCENWTFTSWEDNGARY